MGSDPAGLTPRQSAIAPGPRPAPSSFTVGYFARVAPEKGLHVLAEGYRRARLEHGLPPARLEVAGYLAPEHRSYIEQIEGEMQAAGLGAEFRYHGTLDRDAKIRFLQGLSVLSVPTLYVEPKGLFLLEAWANGVPVIQPRHGAFPEMIEKTGGGVLFEPGDTAALADALVSLARDPGRAAALGQSGASGVRRDYTASRMAERVLAIYASLPAAAGQIA